MNDQQRVGRDVIDAAIGNTIVEIGPGSSGDPAAPRGPWMVTAWALAVDYAVVGSDDEVETWTITIKSKGCPRTQAAGLGESIKDNLG